MLRRITLRRYLLLGLGLLLLFCLACSSGKRKLYPVRGKVLCDGQPAEGAVIALHPLDASKPAQEGPTSRVKADGSFSIGTVDPEDGAPPGEYKVVILWLTADAELQLIKTGRYPNKLPEMYGDAKTTPLRIQVKEGLNDVPPFELQSAKGARK
jgi:hypothetical protein